MASTERPDLLVPGVNSRALIARRDRAVARGVATMFPIFVERATAGIIVDVDGNSFIDLASGVAVTNVGNSHPLVVDHLTEQARLFTHTCFSVTPYEVYVRVCEELDRLTPGNHEKRSALFNSGAEGVENAIKLARAFTRRQGVISFDFGFHGRTQLTAALSSRRRISTAERIARMPMAYPYRWPGGSQRCADEAVDEFTRRLAAEGADDFAAVIVEPIQGEGGVIEPASGFLPRILELCQQHGIVFIADEIQTGFCRTGTWFACEQEGLVPDIIVTAKGIAGGLPLAAVTGRADIMNSLPPGSLGGTFSGNPLACAAALAVMETLESEDLAARARMLGKVMKERLHALAERCDIVGDVRGRGALIGVELVRGGGSKAPDPQSALDVARSCQAAGVIALTCGAYGNVLRLVPPLVIPDHLISEGLRCVEKAILDRARSAWTNEPRDQLNPTGVSRQADTMVLKQGDVASPVAPSEALIGGVA